MSMTLYELLGIQSSASPEEVRKAYKQKALETHPDKLEQGANEEEKQSAEARFHEIHNAFEILNNPQKRRAYDVRMNIKLHYESTWANTQLSEQMVKRMKDREEWARKAEVQYQERMKALKEESRLAREQTREKTQEVEEYADMVKKMLKELCAQNPEWEERKRQVQERKAERAKAGTVVVQPPRS